MTVTTSPTFCPAPWTSLNIDQTGKVFPCMHSGYELGNIKNKKLSDILVDAPLQELKSSMATGQWHSACTWCQDLEKTTGKSGRTVRYCDPATVKEIDLDINYFKPQHLVVNWSNLCNLTCVYCNSETSTAWQSVKKIPINYIRNEHQSLIEIMKEKGHSLQGLTLGGGEPLLQKGLLEMLRCLDRQKVNVLLTTNLSVELETNEIYQELCTWPNVSWMISFDNANKEKFEYVRDRASWAQLEKNIRTLQQHNQHVIAHPAYSIYNAFDLVEYYEYCEKLNLDIFWCELTHPWDLDARRLPLNLRHNAVEVIDEVVSRWGNSEKNLGIQTLKSYKQQLIDNTYITNIDNYTLDTIEWHKNIETQLNKTNKFDELWKDIADRIKFNNEN